MSPSRPEFGPERRIAANRGQARRVWLGISLLILGVLLAYCVGWLGAKDTGHQHQRLPDGSTIALLESIFGDEHRIVTGVRWQKLLWELPIAQVRQQLTSVQEYQRANPAKKALTLWLRHLPGTDQHSTPYEAFDESGNAVLVEYWAQFSRQGSSNDTIEMWNVDTFPRRGATVGVRMLEETELDSPKIVAEFHMRNPDPGPHPVWTPTTLPVSVHRDGLNFELRRFTTRTGAGIGSAQKGRGDPRWTQADFRITRNGRQSLNWYAKKVTLSDATGNKWSPTLVRNSLVGPNPIYGFKGSLDPRETYRLRVEFSNDIDFGAADRQELPLLTIPAIGKRRDENLTSKHDDLQLNVVEVLGPGTRPDPVVENTGPYLHVTHIPSGVDDERVVLLRVVDQAGRVLEKDAGVIFRDGNGHIYFGLENRPTTRAVRVTLGVRPVRVVEFLAKPEPVTKAR